jgi:ssDNA-binding Zn-finger/Zn-ribbon topoisomerase 1
MMRNIILLMFVGNLITGCIDYNIVPTVDSKDILRKKNGGIVEDCQGGILLKNSPFTKRFWEKNNLPKGTTEFTCVDGKAYLPEKVPPKN